MSIFKKGSRSENSTIHVTMMKNWLSHILFFRKRGLIVYLAALKRGLFAPHIRTMSYIGSYPPPPPPRDHKNSSVVNRPAPHEYGLDSLKNEIQVNAIR